MYRQLANIKLLQKRSPREFWNTHMQELKTYKKIHDIENLSQSRLLNQMNEESSNKDSINRLVDECDKNTDVTTDEVNKIG